MSDSRLGRQAVRLTPARLAALRVSCREDPSGMLVGGAVPVVDGDYLVERGLGRRPFASNPWWVVATDSGRETLGCAEAT